MFNCCITTVTISNFVYSLSLSSLLSLTQSFTHSHTHTHTHTHMYTHILTRTHTHTHIHLSPQWHCTDPAIRFSIKTNPKFLLAWRTVQFPRMRRRSLPSPLPPRSALQFLPAPCSRVETSQPGLSSQSQAPLSLR